MKLNSKDNILPANEFACNQLTNPKSGHNFIEDQHWLVLPQCLLLDKYQVSLYCTLWNSPYHWNIWMQLRQNLEWQYEITNEYGSRHRNYLVLITRQFPCVHDYHKWEALCSLWDGHIKWHLLQSIHLILQFSFPVVKRLKTLFNLHFPSSSSCEKLAPTRQAKRFAPATTRRH